MSLEKGIRADKGFGWVKFVDSSMGCISLRSCNHSFHALCNIMYHQSPSFFVVPSNYWSSSTLFEPNAHLLQSVRREVSIPSLFHGTVGKRNSSEGRKTFLFDGVGG